MAKKNTNHPPRFVNLAVTVVTVFDETKRNVRVAPWHRRDIDPNGIFVVEGAHYQKFVSGRGPLHPFPAGAPLPVSGMVDTFGKRMEAESKEALDVGAVVPPSPTTRVPDSSTPVSVPDVDDNEDQNPEDTEDAEEGADGDDAGTGGEDTGDGDTDGSDDTDADADDVEDEGLEEDADEPKRSLADRVLGRKKPTKKTVKKKTVKKKKGG